MINLEQNNIANPFGLDYLLKQENALWGCSTGSYGDGSKQIAHLPDGSSTPEQDTATAIQIANNTLVVDATETTILADNIDETIITCVELGLTFDYRVWVDGIESVSGSVADGTMEYSTNKVGAHTIEIKDPASYATGYAIIVAEDV
jgi:hypothetical protein